MKKKIKNKLAQLQMTENVVVIVFIIFILIFGLIFYNNVKRVTYTEKITEYSELDLVKSSQKITNLPELSCSVNEQVDVGCIDALKLEAFIELNLINSSYEYYKTIFGKSKIIINTTFPVEGQGFVLYNNPYAGDYNQIPLIMPIKVYDPITMITNLGYIKILKYTEVLN